MQAHRMFWIAALVAATLLAPARPAAATAAVATPAPGFFDLATPLVPLAQAAGAKVCGLVEAALREAARDERSRNLRLDREEVDLNPPGAESQPQLCILYYPAEDAYQAIIAPVDGATHFRAAKADATRRLTESGVDLCRITTWLALTRQGTVPRLQHDDRFEAPLECAPRLVAADQGAEEWLAYGNEALARIVDLTASQMQWRPHRPLTVFVLTDPEVAAAAAQRSSPDEQREHTARLARQGQSWFSLHGIWGSRIHLNLAQAGEARRSSGAMRARIDATLIHEYTHFAQQGIAAVGTVPHWFVEGQALYQEGRNSRLVADLLALAERAQHEGTALPLSQLTAPADWFAHEQTTGRAAVYSRAYAALTYLVERYGFPITVDLLRVSQGRGFERFHALLAQRTGLDLDTLDNAVGAWLTAPGRVVLRDDFSSPGSGWPRQSSDPARAVWGYEGGEYAVVRQGGCRCAPTVQRPERFGDFLAEIDGWLVPPLDGALLHLDFRHQPNGDRYSFVVKPDDGSIALLRISDGRATTLVGPTRASALRPNDAPNRLGVRAHGAEVVLYVNGQEVGRAQDEAPREGWLSLSVSSTRDSRVEGRFRNLVVTTVD